MTFTEYLDQNQVDKTNDLAVGQAAKAFLRKGELTEEEKPWVSRCLAACKKAMESWQREQRMNLLDKTLPKL